jgi:hypothetical protein
VDLHAFERHIPIELRERIIERLPSLPHLGAGASTVLEHLRPLIESAELERERALLADVEARCRGD